MPVLRLLFIVLIVLNLLALAAGQGWLGSSQPRGEPERITNQLNPERIVVEPRGPAAPSTRSGKPDRGLTATPPAPASPAPEPVACIAYGGLTASQADALEGSALAQAAALQVERHQERVPSGWWVRLPPAGSRDAADRKVGELRAQGITDYYIVHEPGPNQYAVSLGLFKTEAAAQQHQAYLQSRRIRGASIAARESVQHRVRIHGPAAELDALAAGLARELPGALRDECTP